jgi:asparagine synthase (glutamine-hydrolysing)
VWNFGFGFQQRRPPEEWLRAVALTMQATLQHRGPDDGGVWTDTPAGLVLGHRRLSILDLSAAGRQPMLSACGRWVITYNGEVYNFQQLRSELKSLGHTFRGHSDTEVILAAIAQWGIENAVRRLNGMFAFGVWDQETHTLTLARDRVGKKPLYYGWCGDVFLFGSELKALRAHPDFEPTIDRSVLGLFLQYSWVPAPYSIYTHVQKLPAASLLSIDLRAPAKFPAPRVYWSARDVAEHGERQPYRGSFEEATQTLDTLLRDAVSQRMIADVNLGALLSGGIDSTTIVALMQSMSSKPVQTFSIGFREPKFNEAQHALAIARHLGTDHTELYVTAQDAMAVLPHLPSVYDEPFADPSQIPTFLLSKLARRKVSVALSGDGGDELFIGYKRAQSHRPDGLACIRASRLSITDPNSEMAQVGDAARKESQRHHCPEPCGILCLQARPIRTHARSRSRSRAAA